MKKLIILALCISPAHSAVLWTDNFEGYNLVGPADNLETQSAGSWLTDPQNTTAIAVIANSGLPTSFGGKSLAVGGIDPGGATTTLGVAYALSPEATGFNPTASAPFTELSFSADFILNSGAGGSLVDDFRLSFEDLKGTELAALLFTQALDGAGAPVPGYATIVRSNVKQAYNTQVLIALNSGFRINLVMSPLLNKWSGSINELNSGPFSMFANVDLTQNEGPPVPEATIGSFAIDWMKNGSNWGSNYLIADNFILQSQTPVPEPSVPLMISVFTLGAFLRRRR